MIYKIIRSNRKTTVIQVDIKGNVFVRSPFYKSDEVIDTLVKEYEVKILEKVAEKRNLIAQQEKFQLEIGDFLPLAGKKFPIIFYDKKKHFFDGENFVVNTKDKELKQQIINIYKKMAKEIISERACIYANIMGINEYNLKITSAKKRWGSCSKKCNIQFSWLLVMAGLEEIDYIVVHELSHIMQRNHSEKFWEIVSKYCPNYELSKERLKLVRIKQLADNWV